MTIMPKRGAYYIFPPNILHGVGKVEEDTKTRYCLVSNLIEQADWKTRKVINDAKDKNINL
jgi:quercetin dioxygenase-like cupin family protein